VHQSLSFKEPPAGMTEDIFPGRKLPRTTGGQRCGPWF
jgi:hypothetical protein